MTPHERQLELDQIQEALCAARRGGASIPQLVKAHELAQRHQASWSVAELRTHLRHLIPDPTNGAIPLGRTMGIGMMTGLLTFFVIRYLTKREPTRVQR